MVKGVAEDLRRRARSDTGWGSWPRRGGVRPWRVGTKTVELTVHVYRDARIDQESGELVPSTYVVIEPEPRSEVAGKAKK